MNFIDQIVTHIIRPTRELYRIGKLGPKSFIMKSKLNGSVMTVNRQDIPLINSSKQKVQISHYTIKQKKGGTPCPTVIYLHGNNGSRNQGTPYIRNILEYQMEVVLLDFAGSGLSEGDFVTLGVKQSDDIATVVQYLRNQRSEVFLWGRSMGAVASLIYLSNYPNNIKGAVVDSPFSTLRSLIKQLASSKTGLPQFFFHPVLPFIDKELKIKTGISFDQLEISQLVRNVKECPALFITSENDQMVKHLHTEHIFKNYQGPKQIQYISQQHHQIRNKQVIQNIIDFFQRNSSTRQYSIIKQQATQKTEQAQPQSQQSLPQQKSQIHTRRQNNFVRSGQHHNLQQKSVSQNKKIKSALIQNPMQKVNSNMAYYQPPEKISMTYLNKVKPQHNTYFYRQNSNSVQKTSGIRSMSSQYRISGVSRSNSSKTPRGIHSRSLIKFFKQQDGYSKVNLASHTLSSRR